MSAFCKTKEKNCISIEQHSCSNAKQYHFWKSESPPTHTVSSNASRSAYLPPFFPFNATHLSEGHRWRMKLSVSVAIHILPMSPFSGGSRATPAVGGILNLIYNVHREWQLQPMTSRCRLNIFQPTCSLILWVKSTEWFSDRVWCLACQRSLERGTKPLSSTLKSQTFSWISTPVSLSRQYHGYWISHCR